MANSLYSYIITLCLSAFSLVAFGQKMNDAQWLLFGSIHLDFRGNELSMDLIPSFPEKISPGYASTVMNSDEGEILFYSGGCDIITAGHVTMHNGDSLNPGVRELGYCKTGSLPWEQPITIVPFPGHDNHYLAFTLDMGTPFGLKDTTHLAVVPLHLYFHEIDMGQNGGQGKVGIKNLVAINDTLARGYIQAVPHANGRDWWVTVPEWNSNCYYSLIITPDGIDIASKSCAGLNYRDRDLAGFARFSPDGTKYARCRGDISQDLEILSFDRCTGIFSNPIYLDISAEIYFTGVGFSPNSRFLYVTTRTYVWQFDLFSPDVQNSGILIGELLPENAGPGKGTLYHQQLGPDGIIYIASPGSHKYLSTINHPNQPGTAAKFLAHNIMFPGSANNYGALPNNAIFRLGPEDGSMCDTLQIDNIPVARFRFEKDSNDSTLFKFINNSYFSPTSYSWDFGDGFTSEELNPVHNFNAAGNYNVCLTAFNSNGSGQYCREIALITNTDDLSKSKIDIFPNPATDIIKFSDPDRTENTTYNLLTFDGRLIKFNEISFPDSEINVSQLPAGIYFLQRTDPYTGISFKKVIILR